MQQLTMRSLQTKAHPQTKWLFWYLFSGTRGGQTRVKIMSMIQNHPGNINQLRQILCLDYKAVQHHIKTLEKNNLVSKLGEKHAVMYYASSLFEEGKEIFDEILSKQIPNNF